MFAGEAGMEPANPWAQQANPNVQMGHPVLNYVAHDWAAPPPAAPAPGEGPKPIHPMMDEDDDDYDDFDDDDF